MSETEQASRDAWAAMAGDDPMPVEFAVDMVQDATGDRGAAVLALCAAAARTLKESRDNIRLSAVLHGAGAADTSLHATCVADALATVDEIAAGRLDSADVYRRAIYARSVFGSGDTPTRAERRAGNWWRGWAYTAELSIATLREARSPG